ncbi:MAG: insulinase family protein, partial [bacterium]|nr:insulinase family protein [bacterium]
MNTLFGASFTSRLNQNIREKNGFSYGARSGFAEDAGQWVLTSGSSVQTKVTGPALTEFKREFEGLATGNVTADELEKAVRTVRFELETSGDTTAASAEVVANLVRNGRPTDACARTRPRCRASIWRPRTRWRGPGSTAGTTCWWCWWATRPKCCRNWRPPVSRHRKWSTRTDSPCPRHGSACGFQRERPAPPQ